MRSSVFAGRLRLCALCIDVVLDSGLESLGVGANDLGDLGSVLEKDEGRHGADTEVTCNVGGFVDVELVEARVGVLLREPSERLAAGGFHGRAELT